MEFKIQNKMVGDGHPMFFIAEAGVNHNGLIELGKELIDVAVDAKADAVKFQTYNSEQHRRRHRPPRPPAFAPGLRRRCGSRQPRR